MAVDEPLRHGLRIRIGGDFPDFGRIFQSRDKAGSARRLIDGAHPRRMSLDVADLDDLGDGQVAAVENDDSVGEIIGGGEEFSVARHGDVAGVEPGPDLRDRRKTPQVEFRDPSIAR